MEKKSMSRKNKIICFLFALLLIAFFIPIKNSIQLRNTTQGDLMFYVMDNQDIQDEDIQKWYMKNYQKQGITTFIKNDEKYIMLSLGEQEIENMNINVESIVGFKGNILINGRIDIPKSDIKQGLAYPHKILRIKKDPRNIELGTLNLMDPYRYFETTNTKSIDTAILNKIEGDNAFITTFNHINVNTVFSISETAKREILEFDINPGEIIGVNINYENNNAYPIIENIRAIKSIAQEIKIISVNVETQSVTINISGEEFEVEYVEELAEIMTTLDENTSYMVMLENKDGNKTITSIIGL